MVLFQSQKFSLVDNDKIVRNPGCSLPASKEEEDEEEQDFLQELARYVEARLISTYGFIPITIPDDDSTFSSSPHTSILASANWLTSSKLLLIIQNSSGSLLGIFSRTLCKKEGLSKGTVFLYVERALADNYGVLILRPNTNSISEIDPATKRKISKTPIIGSESPEIHALYVLENIIPQAEQVNHIALLGYGNGASLCKDLFLRQMVRSKEDGRSEVNRIGAFVTIEASTIIEEDDASDVKKNILNLAVNFECSTFPRGYRLNYRRRKLGCTSISVGLPEGDDEVQNVATSITLALDPVFDYLRLALNNPKPAGDFATAMAIANNHDPSSAEVLVNPNEGMDPVRVMSTADGLAPGSGYTPRRGSMPNLPSSSQPLSGGGGQQIGGGGATRGGGFFSRLFSSNSPVSPPTPGDNSSSSKPKRSQSIARTREEGDEEKLTVADFDLLKVVGKGAFGKVMLVRKKTGFGEGSIYAMKVLKKSVVAAKGQIEHTKSERSILCEIRHPFIVRLRFAFQSDDKLYLVTDYYNGGSLFYHLRKSKHFSEERARFYAAELLSALDHLHQQHIIYRDLKLENILMDHVGHIALTDFGLSKQDIDKTGGATTFCGTAEYIAPELLRGYKYGAGVDWWSFGILLFEMIHGRTPFYDKNRKLMFYRIIHTEPVFPANFSNEARECLRGLLRVSETERLGNGEHGAQDIMNSPFFRVINFEALLRKEIAPPFVPEVKNEVDTKYVPKAYLKAEAKDSFAEPQRRGDPNANFEAFTFAGEESALNG